MKKKNKIMFYPFSKESEAFAPRPVPTSKTVPSWYKRQASSFEEDKFLAMGSASSTVKRCMPVFDAMTAGYTLLTPCDIYVDARDPEKLVYSVPHSLGEIRESMFATHTREQYQEYPIDKDRYHQELLRVNPLWVFRIQSGYSSLILPPLHHEKSPIEALPGIIDSDNIGLTGHFSFIVEKNFNGIIKQGTPMFQIIPIKREPWESEFGTVEDFKKIERPIFLSLKSSFVNGYKNKFRMPKEYK